MTAAQLRLAETIETFYGAADRTSEGSMAAHAYKRNVEELDNGIGREMVRSPAFSPRVASRRAPALIAALVAAARTSRTARPSWSPSER